MADISLIAGLALCCSTQVIEIHAFNAHSRIVRIASQTVRYLTASFADSIDILVIRPTGFTNTQRVMAAGCAVGISAKVASAVERRWTVGLVALETLSILAISAGIETEHTRKSVERWSVRKEAILANIGYWAVLAVFYIAEDAGLRGKRKSWQTKFTSVVGTAEGTVGDIACET